MSVVISGDAATTRTALGYGTAAALDTGTSANQVVVLDGSAKIPAVDGSNLTGISSGPWDGGPVFNATGYVASIADETFITFSTFEFGTFNERYDPESCFNPSNGRFTPTTAGWYLFNGSWRYNAGGASFIYGQIKLYKNETQWTYGFKYMNGGYKDTLTCSFSDLVYLNGSTDYVYVQVRGNTNIGSARDGHVIFSGIRVSE